MMHEHLTFGYNGWQFDMLHPYSRQAALEKLTQNMVELKKLGVDTMVDVTPPLMGRDPALMQEISRRSGVNIIACTGFYTRHGSGLTNYFASWTPDEIAELMLLELNKGMAGTDIRAGCIKVATETGDLSDLDKKVLLAAGKAQAKAGVPLYTHTEVGKFVTEQMDIFTSAGADMRQVIIGHLSDLADLNYHIGVAKRGANVGMDRIGLELYQPSSVHVQVLAALLAGGYQNQVILSLDTVGFWLGRCPLPAGSPSTLYPNPYVRMHQFFFPRLKQAGIGETVIDAIMVDNARRIFSAGAP
jgi:phosphotriesterase-related protein